MSTTTKKGASPLQLNNKELRLELRRADVIIMTAVSLLSTRQQADLEDQLIDCHITDDADPLADTARLQAMHRITPKCNYHGIMLIILALVLGVAWYSVQADNQLLRAELVQVQGDRP